MTDSRDLSHDLCRVALIERIEHLERENADLRSRITDLEWEAS